MKYLKYVYILLVFTLFVPEVYAFTYEMDVSVDATSVKAGTVKEIKVSLKNVQGTSDGIIACTLDIDYSDNIMLNSDVRTLNSWSMTYGEFYLFDTGKAVTKSAEMFVIPVKVNGEGTVTLTDITCSDVNDNQKLDNKSVNFTILSDTTGDNSGTDNNTGSNNNTENKEQEEDNTNVMDDSNCDLTDIKLSEGTIQFDSAITEYSVKVNDFDDFEVTPVLASDSSEFIIDKNLGLNKEHEVIITVNSKNGNTKIYTIYVEEINDSVDNDGSSKESNNYVPIFITIICILVLINVIRIVMNRRK